ncbi:MAG: DUF3500 domain-containing protein [Rhodothermales bacterium]
MKISLVPIAALAAALFVAPAGFGQALPASPETAPAMREAAVQLLATLDASQRERASFPFADAERENWFFVPIPGQRKGLPIKEMTADQRKAAQALLRSALSHPGYLRATGVRVLEGILGQIENNPVYRDPELYYVTLFGDPAGAAPWGWRFEGHHLSLNFSSVSGAVAITPAFFGSNPAQVLEGPFAGFRLHADEEDLARALLESLATDQRALAIIDAVAPRDIISGNKRDASLERFEGIPLTRLNAEQRAMLWRLIEIYAGNARADEAAHTMERFRSAPADSLFFAWAGSGAVGDPHYYRIHTPTMLIEYDNTQNDGNHVHSVLRDLTNDFAGDLLRRHYEQANH